jgi:hypothetical protein
VIWHPNQPKPTASERKRILAMMRDGCILTKYRRERKLAVPPPGKIERHHVVRGNRRMGHRYMIPLHVYYHQKWIPFGYTEDTARKAFGATIKDSIRVFRASHGVDDLELWVYLQGLLGMAADMPPSKIVPRREALFREDVP